MGSTMINAIPYILVRAIPFSFIAVVFVSIIGLRLGWKTATQFSDGFFWAAVIMFSIGFISARGYSLGTTNWPRASMDSGERAKRWAADIFHGKILMAVFGITGLLLIGLSFLVSRLS
jgi:hypothetical protein